MNKVRTGTNKDSKTRSTLAFPPELLSEIQQYEEAFILIPDDLMQSGGTLLDAGRLARDMILVELSVYVHQTHSEVHDAFGT